VEHQSQVRVRGLSKRVDDAHPGNDAHRDEHSLIAMRYPGQSPPASLPDVERRDVSTSEDLAGRTWQDVLLAHDLLRAGVATVDRVLGNSDNSDADSEVAMALTETSYATHRALVKLAEAREMLVDLSEDHPSQRPMSDDLGAESLSRLEAC
jgi:hypothetical protein